MDQHPFKTWVYRLAFPALLLGLTVPVFLNASQLWDFFKDPVNIQNWVLEWGVLAPLVFVGLQILQVVVFVIPGEVTQIAGGYLFGFGMGTVYNILGNIIGSIIAFGLARSLGLGFVHAIAGPEQVKKFDHLMHSPKLIGVFFLLFLIPGLPKDILCYLGGISSVKFPAFIVVSSIARVPGIVGSGLIGKAFAERDLTMLIFVLAMIGIFIGLSILFRERLLRLIEHYAVAPEERKDSLP